MPFFFLILENYGLKNLGCQQDAGNEIFTAKIKRIKVPLCSIFNNLTLLPKWGVF
jgi:hypothetical protein